ncbi:MAG: hypothetical protein L0Y71_11700 [Gemmataceae bacterium]|nr:hypothetical protein [Gemmataceae bacterium]
MTVADLQQFVRNLGVTLASAGAKGPAGDLERMAAGLEIFRGQTVAAFCDFLAQAENYARTGVLPAGKGRRKAVVPRPDSAETVRAAVQSVQALYERAVDPALEYSAIDAEIKALDKRLTKDEAMQVARKSGIASPLKTKKAALESIKRKITERKESFERIQFGAGATSGS